MRWLIGFVLLLFALGTLRVVGCGDESPCGDCGDGDPCTRDSCGWTYDPTPGPVRIPSGRACMNSPEPDGTPCGGGNVCVGGACVENPCADCEDDGNDCTIDCDYARGVCDYVRLHGDSCMGEAHQGRCYDGVCIVCEELDCDDGDLCTTDDCRYGVGCVHEPVNCWDGDRCAVCDPETGECSDTLGEGHWCIANRELGIGGGYLGGSCESGRCTGQLCDLTSEEVYPCPVENPWVPWICCPWEHLPDYPRGYCMGHSHCNSARCLTECPEHYRVCTDQDGVCPPS